jgi:hypothetical protein
MRPSPPQVITIILLVNAGVDSNPLSTNGRGFWYGVGPHSDCRTEWAPWTVAIHSPVAMTSGLFGLFSGASTPQHSSRIGIVLSVTTVTERADSATPRTRVRQGSSLEAYHPYRWKRDQSIIGLLIID